ncbi:hypothetical protein RCU70_05960 [Escherichia marmotae]|nr:hypothetical protein [Escherichia marmotae]
MATQSSDNKKLVFAVVNSDFNDIERTIHNGLNWPSEPISNRKLIEEIHLTIQRGGTLPSEGVFYYPCIDDSKLIFLSNLSDGWDSLLYCLSKKNKSSYLLFRLLMGEYPLMEMSFIESGKTIRLIRVIKENKWIFYEVGEPLWFEEKENYSKRRIADRITYDLLLSYSRKNGIDFDSPAFFKTEKESLWLNEIR